jgi:hypothetical protein
MSAQGRPECELSPLGDGAQRQGGHNEHAGRALTPCF